MTKNRVYELGNISKFLSNIHRQIWDLALPLQDKRNDEGHAEWATKYAEVLLEHLGLAAIFPYDRIVFPAIILHDIGYSQMTHERRMISYNHGPETCMDDYAVRLEHQIYAVELAANILRQVEYFEEYTGHILTIVSQHDTRKGPLIFGGEESLPDMVVRDADKLWRYHPRHFVCAAKNIGWTTEQEVVKHMAKTLKNIDKEGFFFLPESREIARREFEDYRKLTLADVPR